MTDSENGVRARLDMAEREILRTRERLHEIEGSIQTILGATDGIKINCGAISGGYIRRLDIMEAEVKTLATREQMQAAIDRLNNSVTMAEFRPIQRAFHGMIAFIVLAVLAALLSLIIHQPRVASTTISPTSILTPGP